MIKNGGSEKVSVAIGPKLAAVAHRSGSFSYTLFDIALHALAMRGGHERPHLCIRLSSVAHTQAAGLLAQKIDQRLGHLADGYQDASRQATFSGRAERR